MRWEDGERAKPMRAALVKVGIVSSDEALDAMPRTEWLCFYSLRHSRIVQALGKWHAAHPTLLNDQEEKSGVLLRGFRRVDSLGS